MSSLLRVLLAIALVGIAAAVLIGPVAATMLTPGWVETAKVRDWASMIFFLSLAAIILLVAIRLGILRAYTPRRAFRSYDWWAVATLSVIGTVSAAIASHWTIALPGLLPIGLAVVLARRSARRERLVLVQPDQFDSPGSRTATQEFGNG